MLVSSEQWRWKVLETRGTDDDACVSMHTLGGVWEHAPPEKLGALRLLLRPYLYPMPLEYMHCYTAVCRWCVTCQMWAFQLIGAKHQKFRAGVWQWQNINK